MLALSLLGPFAAHLEERPLTQFSTKKAQALLIYLAVEARQTHQREALMALLSTEISPTKIAPNPLPAPSGHRARTEWHAFDFG